jgi:hypothetical protein
LVCASVLVALLLGARSPAFVEHTYARGVSPLLVRTMSALTGAVPFSLAEIVIYGIAARALFLLVRGVVRVFRRRVRWGVALASLGHRLLRLALLLAAVFYLTWGLNYQRAPLTTRLSLVEFASAADRAAQVTELEALCRQAMTATNEAYRQAHGCDDVGAPSAWPGTRAELEAALDAGLDAAGYDVGTEATFLGARGRSKTLLLSPLLSQLRLSGFFFPWTGEANVNGAQPWCDLPQVIAHEKAHQRGIAREDEAELMGYLGCAHSDHPYVRYSAYFFAVWLLRRDLRQADFERAHAIDALRLPGVVRDEKAVIAYWARYETKVAEIATRVNHTYLRTHGIVEGVANYGAVSKLLLAYARTRGSVVPARR